MPIFYNNVEVAAQTRWISLRISASLFQWRRWLRSSLAYAASAASNTLVAFEIEAADDLLSTRSSSSCLAAMTGAWRRFRFSL